MNQPTTILETGTVVVTSMTITDNLVGINVGRVYLEARVSNTRGQIKGIVPGCGGDMYWVEHLTTTAVYGWWEFELEVIQRTSRFDHDEVL